MQGNGPGEPADSPTRRGKVLLILPYFGSFRSRSPCASTARGEVSVRWGLPSVTHLPRRGRYYVYDGRSLREDTGKEILYYHWGNMRHRNVQWPSRAEARDGFAFDRYGFYDSGLDGARLAARRVLGRAREIAASARRRLRKWRAAR